MPLAVYPKRATARFCDRLHNLSSDDKLRRAAKLGADVTINYKTNPEWWHTVRTATDGIGVDQVVDVGGPDTLNQSLQAVKPGGFIAIVGLLTGVECKLDLLTFLPRNARLESLTVGSRQSFEEMNAFLEEHQLHPVGGASASPSH